MSQPEADAPAPETFFLEVTFDGGRFALHALPVDAAEELTTIQELIEVVARHLYLEQNKGKKRVPKGFLDSSRLYLASSANNCFTARLKRMSGSNKPGLFESVLFDKACSIVVGALLAASLRQPLPADFPQSAVGPLVTLGRRLDDDESLLLSKDSNKARVTQETRKLLAAQYRKPLERIAVVEGEIIELDDANSTFQLFTKDADIIEIPFARTDTEKLLEAIRNKPIERVQLRGKMTCTATQKKMASVDELVIVEHDRALDIQRLWDRLDSFDQIETGWLDEDSAAPIGTVIAQAREILGRVLADCPEIDRPTTYPTPIGGIQAEWLVGAWAIDVKFSPLGDTISADATNADTLVDKAAAFTPQQVNRKDATLLIEWLKSFKTVA